MINTLIRVDTHYTRSINLERDADSTDVLKAYIPTTRAIQVLERIAKTFHTQSELRAWSLTAPYGSGKSSFAVFLSHLLEANDLATHQLASGILIENGQLALANNISKHLIEKGNKGYCKILLTGSPEPLNARFVLAMYNGAEAFWKNTRSPSIVKKLSDARQEILNVSEVLNLLKELQQAVAKAGGAGCLCVIDEMGKFLEYEARHQGVNDVFLLQELAEWAHKGHQANLLLFVLMHQDFEQYAKGLAKTQKDEWQKVQGRFESIPFLESTEQTLKLLAAAFKNDLSETEEQQLNSKTTEITTILAAQNSLSDTLIGSDLFVQCYPLHPLSLLILPVLCQKVAQNERTLFSYLGSSEAFGFKERLQGIKTLEDWILPWEIFEYFIHNQPTATTDHLTHRRWKEVVSALERLGDAPAVEHQLLKSIGLFNIIGNQGSFKASPELVNLCLSDRETLNMALESLLEKSLIKYQKFNGEYRVWQGSDFDLELEIKTLKQQLGRDSLADILSQRNPLLPLVARKYSIQQGTLRYFLPLYVDRYNYKQIDLSSQTAKIIIFLAEHEDDIQLFTQLQKKDGKPLNLYLLAKNAPQLREVITEIQALERIENENQALNADPVAQRELKDYLSHVQQQEEQLLSHFLEHPELNDWFHLGESLSFKSRRQLQQYLSVVLEGVYDQVPLIKNELINRDKPSSQANSARKKLVTLMLSHAHIENLGFEQNKFPPEKSIYRALFKETGVHRKQNGVWSIVAPKANNYQMHKVWQGIDKFIDEQDKAVNLNALYQHLQQPPYGIKAGVLPLLFVAYYLANQRRLALYENGVFCPQMSLEHFEILLKRPDLFSVEVFAMEGVKANLFSHYLKKLLDKTPEDGSLLDIIKALARFIHSLPDYTQHIKNLDKQTLTVRDAFAKTQSPIQLLFEHLPKACGFSAFTEDELVAEKYPEEFMNALVSHLKQLKQAYPDLLMNFQQQLTHALKLEPTLSRAELRQYIQQHYQGLDKYNHERDGLQAFIKRLQNNKTNDEAWLESIAALLGKAPPNKWRAEHQAQAEYQLVQQCERLLELAKLHTHQLKIDPQSACDAMLLRLVGAEGDINQVVYVDNDSKPKVDSMLLDLKSSWKHQDRRLQLVALARMLKDLQEES